MAFCVQYKDDTHCLQVNWGHKDHCLVHNHDNDPDTWSRYPKNRRLTRDEIKDILPLLLDRKYKRHYIQAEILRRFGKRAAPQDIKNLKTKYKDGMSNEPPPKQQKKADSQVLVQRYKRLMDASCDFADALGVASDLSDLDTSQLNILMTCVAGSLGNMGSLLKKYVDPDIPPQHERFQEARTMWAKLQATLQDKEREINLMESAEGVGNHDDSANPLQAVASTSSDGQLELVELKTEVDMEDNEEEEEEYAHVAAVEEISLRDLQEEEVGTFIDSTGKPVTILKLV